jgi:hypothetical protein
MRRNGIGIVALIALAPFSMGGCSALENLGGGKKVSPDEFKIVSYSPLTMPPNAELRPPRPGEPRPQETTPSDQAREALSPAMAARSQPREAGAGAAQPRAAGDASEQALVAKASQGGVDPNIRSQVNQDTRVINDSNKSFIDGLIFWQDNKQPSGTIVDPAKEQQRLRDAQATGQPSTSPTPTIERRQRGLLEGIF